MNDEEFLNVINNYVREPKKITDLFDDAFLMELFVPQTEIKPITNPDGSLLTYTRINPDEIYVKIKGPAGVMRFGYYDFSSGVQEEIRHIILEDFGGFKWQSLYVDYEDPDDYDDLNELLEDQRKRIIELYGECNETTMG